MDRIQELARLLAARRLVVLTGAGCSTASGIPDYRDEDGAWKRRRPVQYLDFVRREATRRRYWARSFIGWARIEGAQPNAAHLALVALERQGRLDLLLTQNVDGLHERAGSRNVLDLHGRLDQVRCLACDARSSRAALQRELEQLNPGFGADASTAPDGDADLEDAGTIGRFEVPDCPACGGLLKPDVVFFGENVPPARVERAFGHLAAAEALLVVGSSLMVWSGYRFARAAAQRGIPVAAVNLGRTRADAELTLKLEARCDEALPALAAALEGVALAAG